MNPGLAILDGHNDTLLRLWRSGGDFGERATKGHLDLPRAREGGFAGGFFAIFVPDLQGFDPDKLVEVSGGYEYPLSPPVERTRATRVAGELAAILEREDAAGSLRIVRAVEEIESAMAGGVVAAILHLEGAEPLDPELSDLESWCERGLRSVGIVWSRPNAFAAGVPFRFPASPDNGPGLTAAGRALVAACNDLGLVVDLSHLNERGFRDVERLSTAPLVVSHAGAHALCPVPRNLTDEQLRAVAASGGVVGIVFSVPLLRGDGALEAATPLEAVVRHVEHVAEVAGLEHVALGSDFDGATIPEAIGDAAGLPRLVDALRAAGWRDGELRKLAHENWLRVLRDTWKGSPAPPSK